MSEMLAAFTTRVNNLHSAPALVVTAAKVTQAIEDAIDTYSKELPLELSVLLVTNSTSTYTLTSTVGGWDGSYLLIDVVTNYEGDQIPLDSNAWDTYELAGVHTLKIRNMEDYSGDIYLIYTYPHTLTSGATTIRQRDLNPLSKLAASNCCKMAAASSTDSKSSSINGSAVNYDSISSKWLTLAKEFRSEWDEHLAQFHRSGSGWGEWDFKGDNGFPNRRGSWT